MKGKILSVAFLFIIVLSFSRMTDYETICKFSVFGMLLVVFGDAIGNTLGSLTDRNIRFVWISSPSPGWAFVFLGWILIFIAYVVGFVEIFIK